MKHKCKVDVNWGVSLAGMCCRRGGFCNRRLECGHLRPGVEEQAGGNEELISMDMSEDLIKKSMLRAAEDEAAGGAPSMQNFHLVGDDEYLPLQPNSLDLVISSLGLHWINDLPGAMLQVVICLLLKKSVPGMRYVQGQGLRIDPDISLLALLSVLARTGSGCIGTWWLWVNVAPVYRSCRCKRLKA